MTVTSTDTYVKWASPGAHAHDAIVCDLDDTLAKYCHKRRLLGCHEFAPMPLLEQALKYQEEGVSVILASARPEWCYEGTRQWVQKHGLRPSAIYLKNRRCVLPAHDLKKSMLMNIADHHQIIAFYDDSMMTCLTAMGMGVSTTWIPGNESYWEGKAQSMGWDLPADWRAKLNQCA